MPATNSSGRPRGQDYVINTLKSHQAWEWAEQMLPLLGPNTAVVTAQNGIPWWYFYGFEGVRRTFSWRASIRADGSGIRWARARHRMHRLPALRSCRPAWSNTRTATAMVLASRRAWRPTASRRWRGLSRPADLRRRLSGDPQRHLAEAMGKPLLQSHLGSRTPPLTLSPPDPARASSREDDGRGRDRSRGDRRSSGRHRASYQWRRAVGAHRTSMLQDLDKGRRNRARCAADGGAGDGASRRCPDASHRHRAGPDQAERACTPRSIRLP